MDLRNRKGMTIWKTGREFLKIVHVMDWYVPNMGYQENFLPSEQARLGHDVKIICSGRVPPVSGFSQAVGDTYPDRLIGFGKFEEKLVCIHRLPSIEVKSQVVLIGLEKKINELKPDIIQLHGAFTPSTIRVLLSNNISGRIFVDDHCHEKNFHINTFLPQLYVKGVKFIYRLKGKKVLHFLPVTDSASLILQKILNISEKQLTLFPLGADTKVFSKSDRLRLENRKKLGIKDDDILIVSAGKFNEFKKVDSLINAFNLAYRENSNLKLLLIGNGPQSYMASLRGLINQHGLEDRITITGFVQNSVLPSYYNSADIGVWPGDPSITVIEAIATGLPVIIPKKDKAYRQILECEAGFGIDENDIISLKNGLISLASSRQLRALMSNNCLMLINNYLSWEKIAELSIKIYETKGDPYE